MFIRMLLTFIASFALLMLLAASKLGFGLWAIVLVVCLSPFICLGVVTLIAYFAEWTDGLERRRRIAKAKAKARKSSVSTTN